MVEELEASPKGCLLRRTDRCPLSGVYQNMAPDRTKRLVTLGELSCPIVLLRPFRNEEQPPMFGFDVSRP